ncbi:MAG: response regulator transcription factor [Betaproteobacteria bacterium]|jgi:two-component system OmpR family response regulator
MNLKLNHSHQFVVALVEDDRLLRQEVENHLKANGFLVYSAASASELNDSVIQESVDIFIIDMSLPGESGLSLCKRIRASLPNVGIVIMTANANLHDRIAGYSHGGADMYLTKPVSPVELVLVLQGLGKRVKKLLTENSWSLKIQDRVLISPDGSQKLRLTSREKTLLIALANAKGNILDSGSLSDLFTTDDIDDIMSKHALEEMIARFRKKIKSATPADTEPAIKSVWGKGYQLCLKLEISN